MTDIVPADSRYVPLQQQPYLCCPTAIQIVMLRHKIPLIPAEFLGHHFGLVVRPEDAHYFYNCRTSAVPPENGYGTHIGQPGLDPNAVFDELQIPLSFEIIPVKTIPSFAAFQKILTDGIDADHNMLLCLRWKNVMEDKVKVEPADQEAGHVVVVDRVYDQKIRIIDPARGEKWKEYDAAYLYEATRANDGQAAGIWVLKYKGE